MPLRERTRTHRNSGVFAAAGPNEAIAVWQPLPRVVEGLRFPAQLQQCQTFHRLCPLSPFPRVAVCAPTHGPW